jgi:DNA-binding transcriptional LysR family regulator
MNLYRAEVFASIVKHRSVTKASQELHSSQSALSQHLKILRQQFGNLYEKKGRHIKITERGRDFAHDLEPLFSGILAFKKKYDVGYRDTLTVGSSLGPFASALPALIKKFKGYYPHVTMELTIRSSVEIEKLVLNGKAELAVIANPSHAPSLDIEWLRKESLALFVTNNHPWASRIHLGADDFAKLPLIITGGQNDRNSTEHLLGALMARGIKPNVTERLQSANAVMVAVKKGAGAGILYYDTIKLKVNQGEFKVLTFNGIDLSSNSYIIRAKKQVLSNSALDFLTLLRAAKSV